VLRRLRLLTVGGAHTTSAPPVVLVGAESAGKSTLAAALAGTRPRAENLPGSTIAVETLDGADRRYVDTPGVVHRLDTTTSRLAVAALVERDDAVVLLVLRATRLDDDLAELLPTVAGRRGVVAVTHWDRVEPTPAACRGLAAVAAASGVPFVPLDARAAGDRLRELRRALAAPGTFTTGPVLARVGWRIEPPAGPLEHRWAGPLLGAALLLGPAVGAVWLAVTVAGRVEPSVEAALAPVARAATALPFPLDQLVAGDYGLVTMGPLLLVWALPVVVVLALLLGVLRASGLLDRLTTAVHPLVRPFGLTGRDLVRVVAGYGCNVPAVVATRACSSCSRDATIAAISFGAACSYQLAATLAVLAAARRPGLVVPYLAVLAGGALLHARTVGRSRGVQPAQLDLALLQGRAFLVVPRWRDIRREAATTLSHVTGRALPIFLGIVLLASLLAAVGVLDAAGRALDPLLGVLRLPSEVALPVVVASVRKDGLLLLAEPGTVAALDAAQLLAALVLAGALLPCLVTALTVARERGLRFAGRLLARQAAVVVTLVAAISWAGALVRS
jgi:ferrous iron transport protein B